MTEWNIPRAVRPKRTEYLSVADRLRDDSYLGMTVKELVAYSMSYSGGSCNPTRLYEIWEQLKAEAGVKTESRP